MDVNVAPFEIETKTRHGDMVRADVYLPRNSAGPFPVLLGASPYQKSLRHLPPVPAPATHCPTTFSLPSLLRIRDHLALAYSSPTARLHRPRRFADS